MLVFFAPTPITVDILSALQALEAALYQTVLNAMRDLVAHVAHIVAAQIMVVV
jgi:hypothetical protein